MDGHTIQDILSREAAPIFQGVYAADKIPPLRMGSAIIVNTDKSTEPGMHWLALYQDREALEFFDSYGQSPDFYGFSFTNVKWNNIPLQSITSNVCGAYCIYYILKRCQGYSMYSIIEKLCNMSDFMMYQFVKKTYGVRMIFKQ